VRLAWIHWAARGPPSPRCARRSPAIGCSTSRPTASSPSAAAKCSPSARPLSADDGRAEGDGLLQLYEIYDLKLDAQLALLSACETARGPRVAGEGAFALSRGFLAAGAERVIASLWRVNDASTADLIGALFRGASGGGDWSARLFAAKRAVRARPDTAEPFHWAPFVITGAR